MPQRKSLKRSRSEMEREDRLSDFLRSQRVEVVTSTTPTNNGPVIIPPLNTDIRFDNYIPYNPPAQIPRI